VARTKCLQKIHNWTVKYFIFALIERCFLQSNSSHHESARRSLRAGGMWHGRSLEHKFSLAIKFPPEKTWLTKAMTHFAGAQAAPCRFMAADGLL